MMLSSSVAVPGVRANVAAPRGLRLRAGVVGAPSSTAQLEDRFGRLGGLGMPTARSGRRVETAMMARVAGVDIPNGKCTWIALTYVYGVGQTTSKQILERTGIDGDKRVKDLTEEELTVLRKELGDTETYTIEGDLRRRRALEMKRLQEINCVRGRRHRANLPVRGQRTHTNARTRKGKAVAIAGKKMPGK